MYWAKYYKDDLSRLSQKLETSTPGIKIYNEEIAYVHDLQSIFTRINKGKIAIIYYNHLWEPVLKLASLLKLRNKTKEQNWLDNDDIKNLLNLGGFEIISEYKRMLFPIYIPIFSDFVNKYIATLPIFNSLCLTIIIVAKKKKFVFKNYSTSIIIPARNEEGNIENIIKSR